MASHRGLQAVIFDVDGTIADTERDGHRVAFNQAFEAAGLPWRWDEEPYGRLLEVPGGQQRLEGFLRGCGVPPGEALALARALHQDKQARFIKLLQAGAVPLRPGVDRLLDELEATGVRVAIATTGGREWVCELLSVLLGPLRSARFEAVVTGEDVALRKPDPEVYTIALKRLGCEPAEALAIEDSEVGVLAAKYAGMTCLAVRNSYTVGHNLAGADLVVESLGDAGAPAVVVSNPYDIVVDPLLGAATLQRLHDAAGDPDAPAHPGLVRVVVTGTGAAS